MFIFQGISALGGLSTLSLKPTAKPEQLTESQKDNISQLFGNEEDYLMNCYKKYEFHFLYSNFHFPIPYFQMS